MESWFPSPAARRENCEEKIGSEFDGCALFPLFVFGGLLLLAGFGFFLDAYLGPVGWVFGGGFTLFGALMVFLPIHLMMVQSRIGTSKVTLSVQPLYLGETFQVQFVQPVKTSVTLNAVTFELICQEQVTYTGTFKSKNGRVSKSTKTKTVFSEKKVLAVSGTIDPREKIRGELEFTIPEDAMHTLGDSGTGIAWKLNVLTDIANWPNHGGQIDVLVAPRSVRARPEA